MKIVLGAIADDFTGATDLANVLVRQGMRTVQVLGVPESSDVIENADAVIVALKIRTAPVETAVAQSLAGLEWLQGQGAEQILFKYCSTFDSTPRGNIGPVADALADRLNADLAFVCPAFPQNGRTVVHGHLFVNGALLAESPMKDHPLTPMRDSDLCRLMSAQSRYEVGLIDLDTVRRGPVAISEQARALAAQGKRYAVIDAMNDDDMHAVGRAAKHMKLVTGGSAVAMAFPENFREAGALQGFRQPVMPAANGRTVILAGSCSTATRQQLVEARKMWPSRELDVDRLMQVDNEATHVADWAIEQDSSHPTVIFSSADPADVERHQQTYGRSEVGDRVEKAFGHIATRLRDSGFDRFIVAGGETSGAVSTALGVKSLRIGPEIAPGVPWTEAQGDRKLALALKSGNFGGPDFFRQAWAMFDE